MKKIIFVMTAMMAIFTSCSNSTTPAESNVDTTDTVIKVLDSFDCDGTVVDTLFSVDSVTVSE